MAGTGGTIRVPAGVERGGEAVGTRVAEVAMR